jgi:anti-sigma B factor antagonist
MITLEHHSRDGAQVVEVTGDLDVYTASQLRSLLLDLDHAGFRRIVIDLADCTFADYTGLAVIIGGIKRAREQGGWLAIACDRESILRLFRITGLIKVLNVHASADEALAEMAAKS